MKVHLLSVPYVSGIEQLQITSGLICFGSLWCLFCGSEALCCFGHELYFIFLFLCTSKCMFGALTGLTDKQYGSSRKTDSLFQLLGA